MRRLATLLVLVLGLGVAACRHDSPTGAGVFTLLPTSGDTATGTGSAAELRLMQRRWAEAREGRDYRFDTFLYCHCGSEVDTPVRVRVRGSRVDEVRVVATGASRPVADYYTIERLFDEAIALREQGGRVRVTYVVEAGHPIFLTIGEPERDAGVSYVIHSVAVGR